jgi:hypothetical protein
MANERTPRRKSSEQIVYRMIQQTDKWVASITDSSCPPATEAALRGSLDRLEGQHLAWYGTSGREIVYSVMFRR